MEMTDLLGQKIKELITRHPGIDAVLAKHGIGCTTCNIGDCLFREIVDIHNLSVEAEQSMFREIAAIVFPGQAVAIPRLKRTVRDAGQTHRFSPPVKMLVDEHVHIKKVVAFAGTLRPLLKLDDAAEKERILKAIEFIRTYADAYHHAKEEDILFHYVDESADIIQVMKKEHEIGRTAIRAALAATEAGDAAAVAANLNQWSALLSEHIKKEDEILFPWIDRGLSDSQVGQLFAKFREVEQRFGERPREQERFAATVAG